MSVVTDCSVLVTLCFMYAVLCAFRSFVLVYDHMVYGSRILQWNYH